MKYYEAVKKSMEMLACDPETFFIGYNLKHGSRGYGSLKEICEDKIIEMPVAENLMSGLGMGMSLVGLRPVVVYERHDFILNALDSIVNHIDKISELSHGQYNPRVIIRAIVGSNSPINPGPQHNQNFTDAFMSLIKFPIYIPKNSREVTETYDKIRTLNSSCMVVEHRDLYNLE